MRVVPILGAALLAACACPPPPAHVEHEAHPGGHDPHHAGHDHGAHGTPHGAHGAPHGAHGAPHGAHGAPQGAHDASPGAHGAHGHHDGPLVHSFDEGPEHWRKRFEDPQRDASQKPQAVIQAMGLANGMRVADVGAGTGYFMGHLSKAVGKDGRVLAVDIEPKMVRYLKQRAVEQGNVNVEARLALTDDPLLGAATLDRILIVNTWHHIPKRKEYAAKLHAALKAGGEVWIVDFNQKTERGPKKEHRLLPAAVVEELASAGFETRVDEALLPDQYITIGKRP